MIGKPKYKIDDVISFRLKDDEDKEYTLIGNVYIVDKYGTFFDNSDVSYDIMVESGDYPISYPCLFKHINENLVLRRI